MKKSVAVIGSGPAGLAAGCAAAAAGCRTVIFEQLPFPGAKLLASGGGKCNVSNTLPRDEFAARFGKQWRFMLPALNEFSGDELLTFFRTRQVALTAADNFHYFPESGRARDVLDMFLQEFARFGGNLRCNCTVSTLIIDSGVCRGVRFADGSSFAADAVVIACGGRTYPALGGRGIGYQLAKQCGHEITPLYPAMAGIHTAETWVHSCAGIALPDCIAAIDLPAWRKRPERGELLFTHHGFSAFAVLDLAGHVARLLEKGPSVPLAVNFTPDISVASWMDIFNSWHRSHGTKKILTLLSQHLPRKLAAELCSHAETAAANFSRSDMEALAHRLTASKFSITATDSWDKAMVTSGGVALKHIDPATLKSRLIDNVCFAGEILDLDGPCGGFNITWALASGFLSGKAAATR